MEAAPRRLTSTSGISCDAYSLAGCAAPDEDASSDEDAEQADEAEEEGDATTDAAPAGAKAPEAAKPQERPNGAPAEEKAKGGKPANPAVSPAQIVPLMDVYADAVADGIDNISEIQLAIEVKGGHAVLHERFVARPGSTLAELAAGQKRGAAPEIALRLQELFGETRHPSVAGQPLRVTLLSPAGRPVQTTMDLPGFWAGSYADVRKDMRSRYPRHPWPEDPTQAEATLRAKPRGT